MDRYEIRKLLVALSLELLGGLGVLALILGYAQSGWSSLYVFLRDKGLLAFFVAALLVLLLGLGMLAWPLIRGWAAEAGEIVTTTYDNENDDEKEQPK